MLSQVPPFNVNAMSRSGFPATQPTGMGQSRFSAPIMRSEFNPSQMAFSRQLSSITGISVPISAQPGMGIVGKLCLLEERDSKLSIESTDRPTDRRPLTTYEPIDYQIQTNRRGDTFRKQAQPLAHRLSAPRENLIKSSHVLSLDRNGHQKETIFVEKATKETEQQGNKAPVLSASSFSSITATEPLPLCSTSSSIHGCGLTGLAFTSITTTSHSFATNPSGGF